ncbi:WD40 repeat protein [Giardia muris]|uniref:WD40 repeat protein n=1 Tax=Giardia muris TaxID=5742 RepID=A0A4Z1T690_GIAMU|nr:WD40 repeat protein [Giardia muris]|eukprot:TNJ27981.1 WD40 repeat protein [Giardia muris]
MADVLLGQKIEGSPTVVAFSGEASIFAYGTIHGEVYLRQLVPGCEVSPSVSFDSDICEVDNPYYPGTQLLAMCQPHSSSIRILIWLEDATLLSVDTKGIVAITQFKGVEDVVDLLTNCKETCSRDAPMSNVSFTIVSIQNSICTHPISHAKEFLWKDDLYIAFGDEEGYIAITKALDDFKGLTVLQTLDDAGDYISGIEWSDFRGQLYASSGDGTVYKYSVFHRETERLKSLRFKLMDNSSPEDCELTCLSMDPNGRYLYAGTSTGHLFIYSIKDVSLPTNKVRTGSKNVEQMVHVFENLFLVGSETGIVRLVGTQPPTVYGIFCHLFKDPVLILTLATDGSLAVVASFDLKLYMLDCTWIKEMVDGATMTSEPGAGITGAAEPVKKRSTKKITKQQARSKVPTQARRQAFFSDLF